MKNIHSSAESSCAPLQVLRALEGTEGVIAGRTEGAIPAVNGRENIVERRQYPRAGVVGRLEDITYSVLRDYQVIGEAA
jgi:hypothetical protein